MTINKRTLFIIIAAVLIMTAVMLTGCSTKSEPTPVPTVAEPTEVPTVAEPTAVPEEPTAEAPAEEEPAEEEPEAVAEAPVEEEPAAEEPEAVAEVPAEEEPAAEEPEAVAEAPAEEEPAAEEPEVVAEAPAEEEPAAVEPEAVAEAPVEEEPAAEEPEAVAEAPADEEPAEEEPVAEVPAEEEPVAETEPFVNDGQYAAAVDGVGIPMEEFVNTAVFNRYQYLNMYTQYAQMYTMYGLPLDSLNSQMEGIVGESGKARLGGEAIDQITYNKVLDLEAEKAGITVEEQEVYDRLKEMFAYEDPDPQESNLLDMKSFEVSPDSIADQNDKNAAFRQYAELILSTSYGGNVSFDFLKDYAKSILLDNKLFEEELSSRVFEAEMVNARHILVEDEEKANEILARLAAGESWDALASENSLDTSNKDKSGALGWFGRGVMVSEFENAAFELEPGEISDPVKTNYGYHIIASDGKENRPLTGDALTNAQNALYDEWAIGLRENHEIQSFSDVWMEAVPMTPEFYPISAPAATAEEPAIEETVEEVPAEEPAAEETVEEVSAEEPAVEETVEEVPAEEPAAEETVEEAPAEEPAVEETVEEVPAEEPAVEETVEEVPAEEPAAEETVDEAPAEEPAVEAAAAELPAEEPAVEEPAEESQVLATVNGHEIGTENFVSTASLIRYQQLNTYEQYVQMYQMFGLPVDEVNQYFEGLLGETGKENLGETAANQVAVDYILELEAEQAGIKITDAEVTAQLKEMMGYDQQSAQPEDAFGINSFNLTGEEGNNAEDEAFTAEVKAAVQMAFGDQVSYEYYREYVRHGLMETALVDKNLEDRVFEEEMVNARHILVEDEETAKDILAKLEAGEEWEALAAEHSLDTSNKDNGGALGWFGRGMMVPEFEEAAFALEPGQISDPVQTSYGYHIIASDGKELRPMEAEALASAKNAAAQEWYEEMLSHYDIQTNKEVWLPLVPMEPAFIPVIIDPLNDEDFEIPTFSIGNQEETAEEPAEPAADETTEEAVEESAEEELSINSTEQDDSVFVLSNDAEVNND